MNFNWDSILHRVSHLIFKFLWSELLDAKTRESRFNFIYFRNSWIKKYVSCKSYTKFNLNSHIYVIVINFKCTRAYAQRYTLVVDNNKKLSIF